MAARGEKPGVGIRSLSLVSEVVSRGNLDSLSPGKFVSSLDGLSPDFDDSLSRDSSTFPPDGASAMASFGATLLPDETMPDAKGAASSRSSASPPFPTPEAGASRSERGQRRRSRIRSDSFPAPDSRSVAEPKAAEPDTERSGSRLPVFRA